MAKKIVELKSEDKTEEYVPSEENVNEIIKLFMAGSPLVRKIENGLFSFIIKIPNMKILNYVEKSIASEVGEREMTRSEYNNIRNINHIAAYVTSIGTKDFEDITTYEEFQAKREEMSLIITAGLEINILDELFKFQQDEIAAFNPNYLKNS